MAPALGPTTATPSRLKRREVAPRRRVHPHRGFMAGAIRIGWSVASSTVEARSSARPSAILRHQVGGGRRHDDEVGLAGEPDMADLGLVVAVEQVGMHALAGQRGGRRAA